MSPLVLISALALGQCGPGGCSLPARGFGLFRPAPQVNPALGYSFPGGYSPGFAPGNCPGGVCPVPQASVTYAAPVKQWYTLTNEPGVQGYGSLNAYGQVIVEARRSIAPAAPAPTPHFPPSTRTSCPCCGEGCPCRSPGQCGHKGCCCGHGVKEETHKRHHAAGTMLPPETTGMPFAPDAAITPEMLMRASDPPKVTEADLPPPVPQTP